MTAIRKLNYNKIDLDKLSHRINYELEQRHWNYSTLSKLTKISSETIRKLCLGHLSNPTINTIESIANALNIDIFELLGSRNAISAIEEKSIPLYSLSNIGNLTNTKSISEKITCLVKGSDNSFAVKVDSALEHILVSSNTLMIDTDDILIFDKECEVDKIKNRSVVVYLSEGNPIFGEVIGKEDNNKIFISQRKDTLRNSKVDVVSMSNIIGLLSSIQFA